MSHIAHELKNISSTIVLELDPPTYLAVESETGLEIKSSSLFGEVADPDHLHNIRMSERRLF